MIAVKDYTVHIDNKKRVTLRGALYQYYNVKEYDNGCITDVFNVKNLINIISAKQIFIPCKKPEKVVK